LKGEHIEQFWREVLLLLNNLEKHWLRLKQVKTPMVQFKRNQSFLQPALSWLEALWKPFFRFKMYINIVRKTSKNKISWWKKWSPSSHCVFVFCASDYCLLFLSYFKKNTEWNCSKTRRNKRWFPPNIQAIMAKIKLTKTLIAW